MEMVSYTKEEMDAFATEAKTEFPDLMSKQDVALWWKRWYLKCGHKRLGRIMVAYSKELSKQNGLSLFIRG